MRFEEAARAVIRDGAVKAQDVRKLASEMDSGVDAGIGQLMLALIGVARSYALPAVSGFSVGAVGYGFSGKLYLGANIEFYGCGLNQTVHAEQSVVANAVRHGERGLKSLAVSAAPCGHCRQFLYELGDADKLQILREGVPDLCLADLLPHAFGPEDLGIAGGLLSPQSHALQVIDSIPQTSAAAITEAAIAAAGASYAPYSMVYAGAAVVTTQGRIIPGLYLENAAFNPSLAPLQAAVVSAVFSDTGLHQIAGAVVAQCADSKIDHSLAARTVMASIAPDVELQTVLLQRK